MKTLYTGTHSPQSDYIHTPLIEICRIENNVDLYNAIREASEYDYILFTSQYSVKYWAEYDVPFPNQNTRIVSIGSTTTQALNNVRATNVEQVGADNSYGVLQWFERQKKGSVLIPRSNIALPIIPNGLRQLNFRVKTVVAYENRMPQNVQKIDLATIDKIIFTSPSTIDNFISIYGQLPIDKQIVTRGIVTQTHLDKIIEKQKKYNIMKRFRQYRLDAPTRDRYADVSIAPSDFIYPYFVVEGENVKDEIESMPGIFRFSIDTLVADVKEVFALGIDKVLLFGVIADELKDERGTQAYQPDSLVCRAVRAIKSAVPQMCVMTDVCLCEYTNHGHCGLLCNHDVDNDTTLPLLAQMALVHAQAGADFVAPSAMMDGQIEALHQKLTEAGLRNKCKIMAYSAKYASAFYGPFRDAAASAPSFGDRKTYQMDFRTHNQGLEEIGADIEEGADWTMVKPAMPYLDIIARGVEKYPNTPMVAYQVSGEYSMLKAAAKLGYLDEKRVVFESLIAIKRAGAKYIISYFAKQYVSNK